MCREILQRLRRAVAAQIIGAGAIDDAQVAERTGHEVVFRQRAGAQHAVETLAYQIDQAIGAAQLQLDRWMRLQEFRQSPDHDVAGHAGGHVHPQAPAQRLATLLEHRLQLVHVPQQILAALVEGLAVVGQADLARRPVQQPRAEQAFQLLHGHGRAGLGHRQALGGAREAGHFRHPQEYPHRIEFVHAPSRRGAQAWLSSYCSKMTNIQIN